MAAKENPVASLLTDEKRFIVVPIPEPDKEYNLFSFHIAPDKIRCVLLLPSVLTQQEKDKIKQYIDLV